MAATKPDILLADDDPAILRLLVQCLESAGYQVRCAADGRLAMAAIERQCPDILVTDWEMPNVDGVKLCQWLRYQKLPHYVYTIFLTVRTDVQDLVQGLKAGADDFLKKPVDKNELLARLRCGARVLDLESRLIRLAKCDPLTGLATRRGFYEEADREWARADRHHFPLACVMMDIDFFKRVNDAYGHPVGDEVLRRVAAMFTANVRVSDYISRYGGEEFCVLLPETSEEGAAVWADQLREKLASTTMHVEGRKIGVTASFGVAGRTHSTKSPKHLVDLADRALMQAKRFGRNRVVCYQDTDESPTPRSDMKDLNLSFADLRAAQVMSKIAFQLSEAETIVQATERFLQHHVDIAPIVDAEGRLVGVLSEHDIMAAMFWPNRRTITIREAVKSDIPAYDEDTPIMEIYESLCRSWIRNAIIVKDRRPTGIISQETLLRCFSSSVDRHPAVMLE